MKRCRSLFSPAVGSKSRTSKYPIDDYRDYEVVVEPFAHAGPIAIERLLNFGKPTGVRRAIVADSDISVNTIWKTWIDPQARKECDEILSRYSQIISDFARNTTRQAFKSNPFWGNIERAFNDSLQGHLSYGQSAAYSLLVRKLVFGGVVRCNKEGKLNVGLSWDKLQSFVNWKHSWHQLDELCEVSVFNNYEEALFDIDGRTALVLIDPPYWLPRKGMTQAYTSHDPIADETFKMAVNGVRHAIENSYKDSRIVHTNYWSRPMQLAMEEISRNAGVPVYTTQLDVMTGMNKSQAVKTDRIETAWEFGGRRMFWPKNYSRVEQKELLAA
jgi:site-specific DNA-adenine methylase